VSLRRILGNHLRPYKRLLWLVVLLQAVQTAASLTLPSLNADIIDKGVIAGDNGFIRSTGFEMTAFSLVQIVFSIAAVWFAAKVAMGFGRDLRASLFHRVTDFSAREVAKFGAPSLITRVTNDVQQVQLLVVMATTMMIAAPLTMVIGLTMALREDVGLSIILVFAMPAAVIILGTVVSKMVPSFQQMQVRIDQVNRVMREQITGMRVVRAFVREPEEEARFGEANQQLTDVSLRTGRLMASMFPTVMLIINIAGIAVLWLGADRISNNDLQVGSLVAYLTYLVQILMAVVMTTFMTSMIPRAAVAADRIIEVLETEPSVRVAANPVTTVTEHGTVEFRDVGFRYPGAERPVLDQITFRAEAGETTAIIGSTGAGKSTLVNLVPRLFEATTGSVLVDGVDVKDLDPALLWGNIGYVPQKAYLFSGTIASNLRFGRPEATDTEIWQALEIAQAGDFVASMPNGIESEINQGGTNVSGGQRQRLSIARALMVKPDVYVFDDSFSALDVATGARLRAALAEHTSDATVLIVGQRISTVASADRVIVLENGMIVGQGSHDELMDGCPTYVEIVRSQQGENAA